MSMNKILAQEKTGKVRHSIRPKLLTLAIAQALALQVVQASGIEVTSSLDDDTDCTLREAIATINAGIDLTNDCGINTGNTISFAPEVAGQTITLTQGALIARQSMSINPAGVKTTIDANQDGGVIFIDNRASVSLNQLTITGASGRGIHVYRSLLKLRNSTVTGNNGGGIYVVESGRAEITNSMVSGNTSSSGGAGIDITAYSSAKLTNSTVSGNTSTDSTTVARSGGGIDVGPYCGIEITNSTISGNTASRDGGGLNLFGPSLGVLTNSTVSGNSAGRNGGGIYAAFESDLRLTNSTVTDNTASLEVGGISASSRSSLKLTNSIVASNTASMSPLDADCRGSNTYPITSGTDTISSTLCGGATIADPMLGPLADNGGPTQTHALLASSPAIDNATATEATATDQRGIAAEGVRDSGAYEFTAAINIDGAPSIDRANDSGWFIWRENGVWKNYFVSGTKRARFIGSVVSDNTITNLLPISIEGGDVLNKTSPGQIDFKLNIGTGPYKDGFTMIVDETVSTCASLIAPDGQSIFLGPDRIAMPDSFDLLTMNACKPPVIETLGRPSIDRMIDRGIFLWENASHQWQFEFVPATTHQSNADISIDSSKIISGVQLLSFELNDAITQAPLSIEINLKARGPWYDGLRYIIQPDSNSCFTKQTDNVPLFIGPERVEVGNTIDLTSIRACQPDIVKFED